MRRYLYNVYTRRCPGVITYEIAAGMGDDSIRNLCLYELMQCRARERADSTVTALGPLRCSPYFRDRAVTECKHWNDKIDSCYTDTRKSTAWGDAIWKECFFHQDEGHEVYAKPHFFVRNWLNEYCAAGSAHLATTAYISNAVSPQAEVCGDSRTSCPPCPDGGVRCGQQKCQLPKDTTVFNFGGSRSQQFQLDVSCSCWRPDGQSSTQLVVTKKESGFVELEWPTLFTCQHTVSVLSQRENAEPRSAQTEEVSRFCDIHTQFNPEATAFNIDGIPAGTKYAFTVVATASANPSAFVSHAEAATLRRDFWVPFEASVSAKVVTRDRGGVAQRSFKFSFFAQVVGLPQPQIYASTGDKAALLQVQALSSPSQGWSVTVKTDSAGIAFARLFWPMDNFNAAQLQLMQSITVFYEPAAVEAGQTLAYDGCAAPCVLKRTNAVVHGEKASVPPTIEFIDASAITLRGSLPFYGVPECFADDIEVRVLTAGGLEIKKEMVTANGTFAIPVQRNVAFKLQFARNSTPPYVFVNKATGGGMSANLDVPASLSDVAVQLPFAVAMQVSTPMPNVALALAGGLCEFPLPSNTMFNVKMVAPSCNNGLTTSFRASLIPGDRAVTISSVPPLRFSRCRSVSRFPAAHSAR
jgi:hypothetical protein